THPARESSVGDVSLLMKFLQVSQNSALGGAHLAFLFLVHGEEKYLEVLESELGTLKEQIVRCRRRSSALLHEELEHNEILSSGAAAGSDKRTAIKQKYAKREEEQINTHHSFWVSDPTDPVGQIAFTREALQRRRELAAANKRVTNVVFPGFLHLVTGGTYGAPETVPSDTAHARPEDSKDDSKKKPKNAEGAHKAPQPAPATARSATSTSSSDYSTGTSDSSSDAGAPAGKPGAPAKSGATAAAPGAAPADKAGAKAAAKAAKKEAK
ncbi:unnamed protein product, partial [Amoebophrya sp. A25]